MTALDGAPSRAATNDEREPAPLAISVLRGEPTEEELAAVMAVLSEAYATEVEQAVADDNPASSAWARSQRTLRQPLARGAGAWERFGR